MSTREIGRISEVLGLEVAEVFTISPAEHEKMRGFMDKHEKKHGRCLDPTGGRFTFSFTPTSVGVIEEIQCACGEKLDVTDYDSF